MSHQFEAKQASQQHFPSQQLSAQEAQTLATQAYVFGYPLVFNLTELLEMTTSPTAMVGAPVNLFAHMTKLATPRDQFVSINNDTIYSVAVCDVTREPLVLHVPDTHDRYYVMQFVDAWTNNFAYVGRRSTGTHEGAYVVTGPSWRGQTPARLPVIHAPTDVFTIVGRFAVSGQDDLPAVAALQREVWITPLSRYPAEPDSTGRRLGDRTIAEWDTTAPEQLRFWEQLRAWMRRFPPAPGDQAFVQALAPLGLLDESGSYSDPSPMLTETLRSGAEAGREQIEASTRQGATKPLNGWFSAMHAFDYNVDYLELGTLRTPEWKIANRGEAYRQRAGAARGGLWGNHGYEAAYFWAYVDDYGEQLHGSCRYRLHFDSLPPVDAFWSVTMYDMPAYYLVENVIARYSIGDRTPGLRHGADGSLDILIQHTAPDPAEEVNWLPAPAGDFRPLLRMYQPRAEVLRGEYILPPIRRVS